MMILSKHDLAFTANRLQVPVIMGDILHGRETLSDDVIYGLHEVISELQPDSALLAIALGAKTLIGHSTKVSPNLRILEMECERIIGEYGTIWAQNAQGMSINSEQIFNVLIHTSDDLENMAELLEVYGFFLCDENEQALCKILHAQAKAQILVAEAFICLAQEHVIEQQNAGLELAPAAFSSAALGDNIIVFPGQYAATC